MKTSVHGLIRFSFAATGLEKGAAYAVTVKTQPTLPTQYCVVTRGSGTVATSNVTNVAVDCTTTAFSVNPSTGALTVLTGSPFALAASITEDTVTLCS
jgi:hypothetical protein